MELFFLFVSWVSFPLKHNYYIKLTIAVQLCSLCVEIYCYSLVQFLGTWTGWFKTFINHCSPGILAHNQLKWWQKQTNKNSPDLLVEMPCWWWLLFTTVLNRKALTLYKNRRPHWLPLLWDQDRNHQDPPPGHLSDLLTRGVTFIRQLFDEYFLPISQCTEFLI